MSVLTMSFCQQEFCSLSLWQGSIGLRLCIYVRSQQSCDPEIVLFVVQISFFLSPPPFCELGNLSKSGAVAAVLLSHLQANY